MKGFILTSDWLDHQGKHYLRFMGQGDDGPFELVITDFLPYFFVDHETPLHLTGLASSRTKTTVESFSGKRVHKLTFSTHEDQLRCQRYVESDSWPTFEADIKPPDRYLMDMEIYGSFVVSNYREAKKIGKVNRILNPVLEPAEYEPDFRVASLDIETSRSGQVISIGLDFWNTQSQVSSKLVLLLGSPPKIEGLHDGVLVLNFPIEKDLLLAFQEILQDRDPDLIIGWNVIEFDLSFLFNRFAQFKLEPRWGRLHCLARFSKGSSFGQRIHLNGRLVIDGPATLRLAFYQFDSFSLEFVAQKVLGRGKDIQGQDSWNEIERRFHEDKWALVKYNIVDCELVSDIFRSTQLIKLQYTRSRISGLLMGRVGVSTAAFDHYFIPQSRKYGLCARNIKDVNVLEHSAGGHVLEPKPGIYTNVIVLDFKSLYPSIINTFKIDPISLRFADISPINTPTGHRFSNEKYSLPKFIEELLKKREAAKHEKNKHLSQAIKILMNSFYGVMGSGGCRFYDPRLPSAITGSGRWILKESQTYLEALGYHVLYGDTDSVFVQLKSSSDPIDEGELIAKDLNDYMSSLIKEKYKVVSHLEIEFEKYYKSFYLPLSRSKMGGSKKRYAGLRVQGDAVDLQFTGLEFVRSDWTMLAKNFQYQLLLKVFNNQPVDGWIRSYVHKLYAGELKDHLVYKKRLTKPTHEYSKSRPPHVKAALMMPEPILKELGRRPSISYVQTKRGPIPTCLAHDDIDYDHYLDKQIKPIADAVLELQGKKISEILNGAQPPLFS